MTALLIGGGVFVLFAMATLMAWNVMSSSAEAGRDEPRAPVPVVHAKAADGICVLCDQPLRREAATTDEIVFELERRIGDEQALVAQLLSRPVPENLHRLYLA